MFLSNLLPEIGIHFLDPLLRSSNLVVVDISYWDVEERPHPSCELNGFLLVRPWRTLNFIFWGNGVKTQSCEKLLSLFS